MQHLFEEFGVLQKCQVHYDLVGKSLGTAILVYTNKEAAIRAVKSYNGMPLDGRELRMKIVPPIQTLQKVISGRIVKPNNRGSRAIPTRERSFKGKLRAKTPKATAEELDAEMDDYNMTRLAEH